MTGWLDIRDAAIWANVAETRIRSACQSGALTATNLATSETRAAWRINRDDLDDWMRHGAPVTPVRRTA